MDDARDGFDGGIGRGSGTIDSTKLAGLEEFSRRFDQRWQGAIRGFSQEPFAINRRSWINCSELGDETVQSIWTGHVDAGDPPYVTMGSCRNEHGYNASI